MTTQTEGARPSLAELAAEAGVSLSTISKVLNGRPDVSSSTRARVESMLDNNGYRRRGSESSVIELVFRQLGDSWSMELIRGVENVAREHGMSVVLTETGDRSGPGPEWMPGVLRRRPAAIILVFSDLAPEHQAQLRSRDIPIVVVDPAGDPSPGVPSVGSSNWSGGLDATRHLIQLGHKRIGIITGPEDMMCSLARLDGYRSAMKSASLPLDDSLIKYGDFHPDGGRLAAEELLDLPEPPTAIFAGSDQQAMGLFAAARARGILIPEQLSVVGYDDLPFAEWSNPALTTVHQPLQRMAEEAARLGLRLRDGDDLTASRTDLVTHLVVRDSTAPPSQ